MQVQAVVKAEHWQQTQVESVIQAAVAVLELAREPIRRESVTR